MALTFLYMACDKKCLDFFFHSHSYWVVSNCHHNSYLDLHKEKVEDACMSLFM